MMMVNNELERMMWWYKPAIFLEGLRKNKENLTQGRFKPGIS
jgi:hypothetical protein